MDIETFRQIEEKLNQAIRKKYGDKAWLVDVYPYSGHVVYEENGEGYYRAPYKFENGEAFLGKTEKVERHVSYDMPGKMK